MTRMYHSTQTVGNFATTEPVSPITKPQDFSLTQQLHPDNYFIPKGVNSRPLRSNELRQAIDKKNVLIFKNSRQQIWPDMRFLNIGLALSTGAPLVVEIPVLLRDLALNQKGKPEFIIEVQSGAFLKCMSELGDELQHAITGWVKANPAMKDTLVAVKPFVQGDNTTKAGWQYKFKEILPIEVAYGEDKVTVEWLDYQKLYDETVSHIPYADIRCLLSPWCIYDKEKNRFLAGIKPNVQAINVKVQK